MLFLSRREWEAGAVLCCCSPSASGFFDFVFCRPRLFGLLLPFRPLEPVWPFCSELWPLSRYALFFVFVFYTILFKFLRWLCEISCFRNAQSSHATFKLTQIVSILPDADARFEPQQPLLTLATCPNALKRCPAIGCFRYNAQSNRYSGQSGRRACAFYLF